MSRIKKSADHTVVPQSARPTRVILCVVAFILTAAGVQMAGAKRNIPTRQITTATVTLSQRTPSNEGVPIASAKPKEIERQILSEVYLRRAIVACDRVGGDAQQTAQGMPSAGAIAGLRHDLVVEVTKPSKLEGLRVSITLKSQDIEWATGLVNDLARQYADDCRLSWNLPARQEYQHARRTLGASQQALVEAKMRLSDFLDRHFDGHRAMAASLDSMHAAHFTQPSVPSPPVPSSQRSTSTSPNTVGGSAEPAVAAAMIRNPDWAELEGKIAALTEQREELLVHRTAIHPLVREIENRISKLESRLTAIPRQIPGPKSEASSVDPSPAAAVDVPSAKTPLAESEPPPSGEVVDGKTGEEHRAAAREFWALNKVTQQAEADYEQLAQVERQAWQRQSQGPTVSLQAATGSRQAATGGRLQPAPPHSPRLLWVMLTSALAMAAGVGIISAGLGQDRPLTSAAEVEAALAVPVVGTITTGGSSPSLRHRWQQPISGLGMTLYGTVLVLLSLGILLMAFGPA